ncbi:MAG: BatD family protein [Bacteriovoracia bacterium]
MRYKKLLTLIALCLFSFNSWSVEVEVKVDPQKPIKEEPFNLTFIINTTSNAEPYISFTPGRLNVMGRQKKGVSIRSVFVNGRLSTTRQIVYEYEVVAPTAGYYRIDDIAVEVDGRTTQVDDVRIQVLSAPARKPDFFIEAQLSHDRAYIGESVSLTYYLYNALTVVGKDIKKFPRLNGFLKRMQEEQGRSERVSINGKIYEKTPFYSHILFPEKTGTLKVDSLRMEVQYLSMQQRRGNDPFSNLGFGLRNRRVRTRTVTSKTVELEVIPLPADNMPKNFTGLIGKHKFSLTSNKNKYMVNEAIEVRLTVEGPGALENYSAPKVYIHPSLEEFETNSELQLRPDKSAMKIFDYTYLGRSALNIDEHNLEFSFFDPETRTYKTQTITVPSLSVLGSAQAAETSQTPQIKQNETDFELPSTPVATPKKIEGSNLVAPIFSVQEDEWNWLKWLNVILFFLVSLWVFLYIYKLWREKNTKDYIDSLIEDIKKNGLNYSKLHRLLLFLDTDSEKVKNVNVKDIVKNSELSNNAKEYFIELLTRAEEAQYKASVNTIDYNYNSKCFVNLRNLIRSINVKS